MFFYSFGVLKYVVCLCRGCDGCCICIVRRGAVGVRVWKVCVFHHADVVCLYSMHSLRVVKMVSGSLGYLSITVRNSICVLSFASLEWILFIQPFQLECRNSESLVLITHPVFHLE